MDAVEQELLRLLDEIARDSHPENAMPRVSMPFGRYAIQEEIVRGGSGIVYRATDPDREHPVVLKVAWPEGWGDAGRLRRFEFEGKVAASLDHPNIVSVHERGQIDGLAYLAMDYIEGGTLADWLHEGGHATPRQASRLIGDIAGGIGYAHDRSIIHLDLKPRNIMLRPAVPPIQASPDDIGRIPMVIDFGLARWLDDPEEPADIGVSFVGTPPYMAPEQIREGPRGCGPTADVHALGVILYEILVGRPPFLGDDRFQTIRAVVEAEPIPPRCLNPDITSDLEAICLKCLEKSPSRRYGTANELRKGLGRIRDDAASAPGDESREI